MKCDIDMVDHFHLLVKSFGFGVCDSVSKTAFTSTLGGLEVKTALIVPTYLPKVPNKGESPSQIGQSGPRIRREDKFLQKPHAAEPRPFLCK